MRNISVKQFLRYFNIFFIYSSGSRFVQQSEIICVNLVEDIIRNISVKLF